MKSVPETTMVAIAGICTEIGIFVDIKQKWIMNKQYDLIEQAFQERSVR